MLASGASYRLKAAAFDMAQRQSDRDVCNVASEAWERALPNFFFHVTTANALLGHAGVGIGKADYLGAA